jgi:hypothetical protein
MAVKRGNASETSVEKQKTALAKVIATARDWLNANEVQSHDPETPLLDLSGVVLGRLSVINPAHAERAELLLLREKPAFLRMLTKTPNGQTLTIVRNANQMTFSLGRKVRCNPAIQSGFRKRTIPNCARFGLTRRRGR